MDFSNNLNFSDFELVQLENTGSGMATNDPPPQQMGEPNLMSFFMPLILMVAVFYFLLIRPERKRSKRTKEMRETLQIADEIVTTGGIIGRVLSIKDDTVLIETGGDKTRIRILRSAIAENRTIHDS
jgi:preprotein translocase subunit YajC